MLSRFRRSPFATFIALCVPVLLTPACLAAQGTGSIRGRITVEKLERPLNSALVSVSGTQIGTATNDRGEYRLNNVPAGPRKIRVQRLGFAPATSDVTVVAGETVTLDFALVESAIALEQVVVTATGEQRRREISNSMATISTAALETAPVVSAQQLLSAQSPGVTVLANSGQPGAGGVIKLRGINSISQGNNPIIYVDGVRIFSGNTPTVANARQTVLPLNDIRAEDIERVEIVKGAAATTLYGTEASGGVIQIFTKRGRSGTAKWNAEVVGGTNDLDNAEIHGDPAAVWLKQCRGPLMFGIDVTTTSPTVGQEVKFQDPTCPSSGKWIKTGGIQRYNASLAGGSDITQYFFAGNLSNEEGAIETSDSRTGGFRANFNFRPKQELELSLNSSYQRGVLQWVPDGNLANGFLLNVGRGLAGNYRGGGCDAGITNCMANADALKIQTFTRTDHYISGFGVNYFPIEAWTNRLTIGWDFNKVENRSLIPFGHQRVPLGSLSQGDWNRKFLSVDYASTLKKNFGNTLVSTSSLGGQFFQDNLFSTTVTANDFAGPGAPTLVSAATRPVGSDTRRRVVNAGLFAQEQVSWKDRAFFTAGLRVDGNSAFGKDFGLQAYPKLGIAYVLSDHSFWPSKQIETFKLRGALGESGKAPGAFDAVRTWDPVAGDEAKPGFTPNQLGNPKLGPERTRELELGFEGSAFQGRYGLDMTYFNTRTLDALIQVRYPPSQGFLSRQLENVGAIQNHGLEARAEAAMIRTARVEWRGRLNYTNIKNEATDLGTESVISIGTSTEVRKGYPVPSLFARRILNPSERGVAQRVTDTVVFIGPTFPTKIIGLGSTLTLGNNLTFDGLGEFQTGGYNINFIGFQNALRGVWRPCYDAQKQLAAALKGDASAIANLTALERGRCAIDRTQQFSDFYVEPTDFFRLRYVTVTYRLPQRWLRGAQGASVTLSGRNLFLNTDYSGLDPESADQSDNQFARREYYQLPQLRTFSLSFKMNW
jgi:TonB-linked SusC/RagA family outer membrane protein